MVTWTQVHEDEATLLSRVYFKTPGTGLNYTVPAGANFVRASAVGCGGQGSTWGGGSARARKTVTVAPGDNLVIQVGSTSSASTPGDSWVKRNDGSVIIYADRGRGNGSRGKASLSVGDVLADGVDGDSSTGIGGAASSDNADYAPVLIGFEGAHTPLGTMPPAATVGGGGLIASNVDAHGEIVITGVWAAGKGLVVLEFFDADPGY